MLGLIKKLSLTLLLIAVAVLAITALPTWWGEHLGGKRLLIHMMASGMVVVFLPLFGFLQWFSWVDGGVPSQRPLIVFWALIGFGVLTIATMFACMLPYGSTPTLFALIDLHGWAGYAMAVTCLFMVASLISGRKTTATTDTKAS